MKNIINTSINKTLLNRNDSTDSSISIAYLILVHRLPEQFKRLFKAIYDQDNFYLIYIDNKSSDEIKVDLKNFLKPYKNVNILIKENVIWGGYSMVQAEIDGIKELLKLNLNWDYFINLSGQDYPLKSQKIIKEFLSNNVGKNYLKFANQINSRPETMNRVDNYFIELKDSISPLTYKRPFMKNVIPFIGGQWMILTRNCCSFICNSKEVEKFEKFYVNTLIPDESFFQTVLMNSTFDGIMVNDDKRAIIWIPDGTIKLRPKTFVKSDLEYLLLSNSLFARKFDDNVDDEILNAITPYLNQPIKNSSLLA